MRNNFMTKKSLLVVSLAVLHLSRAISKEANSSMTGICPEAASAPFVEEADGKIKTY